jgi:hypothetical protein
MRVMISQSDIFMNVGPEYAARVIARKSHPCPLASLLSILSLVSRLPLHRFFHAAKTTKNFSEKRFSPFLCWNLFSLNRIQLKHPPKFLRFPQKFSGVYGGAHDPNPNLNPTYEP